MGKTPYTARQPRAPQYTTFPAPQILLEQMALSRKMADYWAVLECVRLALPVTMLHELCFVSSLRHGFRSCHAAIGTEADM